MHFALPLSGPSRPSSLMTSGSRALRRGSIRPTAEESQQLDGFNGGERRGFLCSAELTNESRGNEPLKTFPILFHAGCDGIAFRDAGTRKVVRVFPFADVRPWHGMIAWPDSGACSIPSACVLRRSRHGETRRQPSTFSPCKTGAQTSGSGR